MPAVKQRLKLYRQGDLLFMERASQLTGYHHTTNDDVILKGQHTHRLVGGTVVYNRGQFLSVPEGGQVFLVDHATINLAPGTYFVRRQREYVGPGEEWEIDD